MTLTTKRWPYHEEDEIIAVTEVLRSGKTNYWTGIKCREFEKEFAEFVGAKYAVALMNGTVALEAALYALNIGDGDEVITSCRTFIASASCIVARGAKPVLADIDFISQNITAETISACITSRTKAIIVVHLAGWPAEMEAILALAKQHDLKVIEDCAQAHGASIHQRSVGSWGHIAAFSFCQDKIMTTGGEGGMITTDDQNIFEKIWSFKDHGKSYEKIYHQPHSAGFRWLHDSFGTNWRMTEIQAVIGSRQLKKIAHWLMIRKQNAEMLNEYFKTHPALRVTVPPVHVNHAYYKYYVFIRPECLQPDWSRDRIMNALTEAGVTCLSGSCSDIGFEKAFDSVNLTREVNRNNAKKLGETSLLFLVDPSLTLDDMKKTANLLLNVLDVAMSIEVAH